MRGLPARVQVCMPVLLITMLAAGCELREITVADAHDVVIAEVLLRAGESMQTAYLHRTSSSFGSARVFNARVQVSESGASQPIVFEAEADSLCVASVETAPAASTGTCYVARTDPGSIVPGGRYQLHIELNDGRTMTGETVVPGPFSVVRPAAAACRLEAGRLLEIEWTTAAGASIYLLQTRLHDLREVLRAGGVAVPGEGPVDLTGLAITAADTTLLFPAEMGLFDRFDEALHPILVAIRDGLPAGVRAELTVAAADINYVNWIRGSTFNPSGAVRLSSIHGDGTGVFGSLVIERRELHTQQEAGVPPCE